VPLPFVALPHRPALAIMFRQLDYQDRRLPFVAADDSVAPGEPTECFNPTAVVMRVESLSCKPEHVGAVALSRTGDPATGDFGDAKVIKKIGEVQDNSYLISKTGCALTYILRSAHEQCRAQLLHKQWMPI
jgi:hypothetical protein